MKRPIPTSPLTPKPGVRKRPFNLQSTGWRWTKMSTEHILGHIGRFAKAPNEWTNIEHNMCGRQAVWSPLWWWPGEFSHVSRPTVRLRFEHVAFCQVQQFVSVLVMIQLLIQKNAQRSLWEPLSTDQIYWAHTWRLISFNKTGWGWPLAEDLRALIVISRKY